jgi:hypothetical protein
MRIRTTDHIDDLIVWSKSGVRGHITGNPHTHPGRFSVWWEGEASPHPTSLLDLGRVSSAAELWLAGLFAGQSPDASEVLGAVGDFLSETERNTWLAVCREFQETGVVPSAWMERRRELLDDD